MTDKIVVLSTCADKEEGERLARLLVDRRLAACVSVVPGLWSCYRWNEAIETADECLLLIKSSRALFTPLCAALEEEHSYQVPEALALSVVDGAVNYLNWLGANLRTGAKEE